MASKTRSNLETTSPVTGLRPSFSPLIPTDVVFMSTPPESCEPSRSPRLIARTLSSPSSAARASALLKVRLAMATLEAPLAIAPKANALAVPPEPRMQTLLPSRVPGPPRPSSIAEMAADQSVLLALSTPSPDDTTVFTAPMLAATSSTTSQCAPTRSLWGMVTEQPEKSCALNVCMKSSASSTKNGR